MHFSISSCSPEHNTAVIKAVAEAFSSTVYNDRIAVEGDTEALARVLSKLIENVFVPEIISGMLSSEYAFLTRSDADEAHRRILMMISSFNNESVIYDRLTLCLSEYPEINMDGFICFRLKDMLKKLEKLTYSAVNDLLKEKERDNLLQMLREYSENRTHLFKKITVKKQNERFALFDETEKRVITVFADHKDLTPEEELINGLIYISPESIDISELQDKEMVAILAHIFSGRILD